MIVGCLLVSLATSGCSGRQAGDVAAQILLGLAAVAVHAAVEGGGSGSRSGYDVARPPTACEERRAEWREIHQDPAEPLPEHLRCTFDGEWPDEASLPASDRSEDARAERTPVPRGVCGGTETEQERCEQQRALREQRDKSRGIRQAW